MCNRTAYYKWPEELKISMNKAVQETVLWQREQAEREVIEARKAIEDEGHEIIELTQNQQNLFSLAVKPQLDDARKKFGDMMFELLRHTN
jgi:TRAP-type C4-dicarboxylate transport system substrate-binding protein